MEPKGSMHNNLYYMFYVYILLCSDNSFYTGHTANLKKRVQNHNNNQGSFYLKSKLPVKLAYYKLYKTKAEAMLREKQIKNWSRQKKINLIKYGHPTKTES